jgi:hypothetical protein
MMPTAEAPPPTSSSNKDRASLPNNDGLTFNEHPRLQPWANYDNATADDEFPLDPLEGSELCFQRLLDEHQDSDAQRFRFRDQRPLRDLILKALPWAESSISKIQRFYNCGLSSFVQYSDSRGAYRVQTFGCGLRVCPACAGLRRKQLKHRLLFHLAAFPRHHYRFITLTLRHSDAPLADQLAHLKASFKRLRQTTTWKKRVLGGLAVIEITRHSTKKTWHPHLHILARGTFIHQDLLSKLWSTASRGSHIVDIRAIKAGDQAADEIAGYVGKIPHLVDFDDAREAWIEYYKATAGARMVIKFGETPKEPKTYPDPADDGKPNDWQNFLYFRDFLYFCKRSCTWSRTLLSLLIEESGPQVYPIPPPQEILDYVLQPDD